MENKLWLMPMYYIDFKCKCEKCRHTCCSSWKIAVSQDEYFKLIGMDCSKELHHRIESSFSDVEFPTPEKYKYISFNWLGDCPLQKDGLCMLHAEIGESKLPTVCRLFPRSLKEINGQLVASCSSSCERVVEMLYEADEFKIIEDSLDAVAQIKVTVDEDINKELQEINRELMNHNNSLATNIENICRTVNKEEFEKEYNLDINPFLEALNILSRFASSDRLLSDIYFEINERYKDNLNQFEIDKQTFESRFPNWMHFFENVLNNSLIYENFPFVDNRFDKTNAFKGLCASYGLLRLISIGYTSTHDTKEDLIDAVSELFHLIDHTSFYYNVNVICNSAAVLLKI